MTRFRRLPVPVRLASRLFVGLALCGGIAQLTSTTDSGVSYGVVRGYAGDGSDALAPPLRVSLATPGVVLVQPSSPSAAAAPTAGPVASPARQPVIASPARPVRHPVPPPVVPPPAPRAKPLPPQPPPPSPAGTPGSDSTPPSGAPPSQAVVRQLITAAAQRHGVDPNWMLRIAQCESGFNAYAQNPRGPYDGLFQFLPSTFHAHGGTAIWDAGQQSEITATMLANGQSWAWSCA